MKLPELSDAETLRYNRQIVLKGFDFEGQERLKASHALIVGLGGLGCAAAQYLAAAGTGQLTLLDFDTVSISNLQRQTLHTDARIGMAKVTSAALALEAINPHIKLHQINAHLDELALTKVIEQCDVILDCTDNVTTRERLNRLCYTQKKALVSGAAIRMEGQISTFTYGQDEPCYRCLSMMFGDSTLSCVESGVMAPLVGTIGSLQAMEAIKLMTAFGEVIRGRLLLFDAITLQFREIKLPKNPGCEICSPAKR